MAVPLWGNADSCAPGESGCLPSPAQCADGGNNGLADGGSPGRLSLCVAQGGRVILYAGGDATTPCGTIIVVDQATVGSMTDDPNTDCPLPGSASIHTPVTSHDGTMLDGYVRLPATSPGEKVPVVLWTSPYFGSSNGSMDEPTMDDAAGNVAALVNAGYAVATFSVRGTGTSGGCYEFHGENEQRDHYVLVEWLAMQPWSNGNVAAMGLSYDSGTAWEAAVEKPPHLRTIVVAGNMTDDYLFHSSPQGAVYPLGSRWSIGYLKPGFVARNSLLPPIFGSTEALAAYPNTRVERLCPEVVRVATEGSLHYLQEDRHQRFWDERRLIDRFPSVTTPVLLTQGFQEWTGHAFQDDIVWDALELAPKRMIVGQWAHEFPRLNPGNPSWTPGGWHGELIGWLDHWLKGVGTEAPRLGVVDYQSDDGIWHEAAAWPANASSEVLYLRAGSLTPAAGPGNAAFRSAPNPRNIRDPGIDDELPVNVPRNLGPDLVNATALCPDLVSQATRTAGLAYVSAPVSEATLLAGNPFAWLRLESDQPGGLIAVQLVDLAPDAGCDATGEPTGARLLATGEADLRFNDGNFVGRDFPVGTPTNVRIDLFSVAAVLAPGHRLAFLVGYGDAFERQPNPRFTPVLTVGAGGDANASHLIVPIAEGTFGGSVPALPYPPRPFTPVS